MGEMTGNYRPVKLQTRKGGYRPTGLAKTDRHVLEDLEAMRERRTVFDRAVADS